MKRTTHFLLTPFLLAIVALFALAAPSRADDAPDTAADAQQTRFDAFEKLLTGSKFTGNFTILGRDAASPPAETYDIVSVKKLDKGDYWLFKARIRYGGKDVTLPMPLEVKWAGDTPVISLTNLDLPGLGTFSARVVIYNGKYAGTWTHGKVGGHLFGVVAKETPADKTDAQTDEK